LSTPIHIALPGGVLWWILLYASNVKMSKSVHCGQASLSIWADKLIEIKGPSDLEIWHSNLKINRGHLIVITNLNSKYEDCWPKHSYAFWAKGHYDLDIWPIDFKIYRGHSMVMINVLAKFEDYGSKDP
jgi:hypothetical protein